VTELADLSRLTEETIRLLRSTISAKAALRLRLAAKLPAIKVDATQARQVVMNLLTNASEALTDREGTIHVETGTLDVSESDICGIYDVHGAYHDAYRDKGLAAGQYVYLEVSDTGCGMDEDQKARIFDPFFSTKFTGRGLGLAAVLGIIRGHKGAITVESQPGHGCKIKVLFPAWEEEALVAPPVRSRTPAKWCGSGTVLLVDDERTVRAVVAVMLERMGFRVVTANDGVSALSIVRETSNEIAAVLLDWTMPGISGENLLRELLRIRPGIPVIVSSGFTGEDLSEKLRATGVGFIQKPYVSGDLAENLREIL
jgi:CheY-like chemotaxis protein